MNKYSKQTRMLVAVDCVIFGFDGTEFKILLIHRGFEPERGNWSLMGGFVMPNENFETTSSRVLKQLTGLENVYMEQMYAFGSLNRDPVERTISVTYFALIDINEYQQQLSDIYHAEWFSLSQYPQLIFDHEEMVKAAKDKLRYKAALHPILFELLPLKFTLPQLLSLYEQVYDLQIDKRNFSRKVLSTNLLIQQKDKDKSSSKKGAFYYKLNKKNYSAKFNSFLNFMPESQEKSSL